GPYPVVVNVQVPGVVPGVANVYVRVTGDATSSVQRVLASGNIFDATAASPPPEVAEPVPGDPNLYHVGLWMMTPGSSSITVVVRGTRGVGKLVVPVVIVANQRLVLNRPLGIALATLGVLLFLGIVSIAGAMAREAGLPRGATPDPRRRRNARLVMSVTAVVAAGLLFGGWTWWNVEDQQFRQTLYKPMASRAAVRTRGGVPYLDFMITEPSWMQVHQLTNLTRGTLSAVTPLVRDHGKLMHLFLVRDPDRRVFLHLHPTTVDSITFPTPLPPVPAGHYRVFADIVRESGYAETMTTTVDLPPPTTTARPAPPVSDQDDAWFVGTPAIGDTALLADGSVMHWTRGSTPIVVNRPAPLRFTVTDARGRLVTLEPYMGMAAHAVILRDDGAVFVHLHPTGTVSMGAQETFALRRATDTVAGMIARRMQADPGMGMMMAMPVMSNPVRFPYAFPKSGHYRIWVQVKRAGRILTGVFDTQVGM
ncbi:MAG TPA: hypothetical protein VNU46_02920, partial [Gemmatimonadaceae bacterium]|nr:hypothetical protein [Gemmatimonadaceae bacterium]